MLREQGDKCSGLRNAARNFMAQLQLAEGRCFKGTLLDVILRFENVRGQVPLQLGDEQTVVHGVAGHLVTSLEYQHRPNKRAPQPAV